MSLSTQSLLNGGIEDAVMISSLISQLTTKSTLHHAINMTKTVKVSQGPIVRVTSGQRKVTSFSTNHTTTTAGLPHVDEASIDGGDKFEPLTHQTISPTYTNLDNFESFLAFDPKFRERVYDHFMNSQIYQCSCPRCAPRPLFNDATAIFNIPGTSAMIIESPQCYCVPQVLSLLLVNKLIYNELRPLFYNKLTAVLALKSPLQIYFPPLHTTQAVRLFPAFQNFVTKWIIELPIDKVLPRGVDTKFDWCIKTLSKEVHRFSLFLEYCKALNHITIVIKIKHSSHTWFKVGDKGQFEFEWLHRFLEFGLDDEKTVKVKIEIHLPHMELWWKKKYQVMWIKGWNAGLIKKGMNIHDLFFRDTESGASFIL